MLTVLPVILIREVVLDCNLHQSTFVICLGILLLLMTNIVFVWFYSHMRVVCYFFLKQGLLGDISVSHLKVKDEAGIELMNVIL